MKNSENRVRKYGNKVKILQKSEKKGVSVSWNNDKGMKGEKK